MLSIQWVTDPEDPRVQVGADLASLYWTEALGPEEPEYPASELRFELSPAPGVVATRLGLAVNESDIVGAVLQRCPLDQLVSSWVAWLYVEPDARRHGVGRALLEAAADGARVEGRRRLGWKSPDRSRAATLFSQTFGATPDETLEHNRLTTSDVDRSLLARWVEQADPGARDYSLVGWDGPCPDELLESFTTLQAVMDDAPGAQAELAVVATPDKVRAGERRWLARGPYWRLCARHDPTGELVGFTELQVPTTRPSIADQGDTGVRLDHRGLGLGRWLKAVNMFRLLDTRPDVRFVDTLNAAANAPMLAINRAMGFRPVQRWQRWDLEL